MSSVNVGTAYVKVEPDLSGFGAPLSRSVSSEFAKVSRSTKVAVQADTAPLTRSIRESVSHTKAKVKVDADTTKISSKLKSAFSGASGIGAAALGGGIGLLGKQAIDLASNVSESLSKNRVLFGKNAADVEKFAATSAKSFGISKAAALEFTGTFGNIFSAVGVNKSKSAELSRSLVSLGSDLASFNNTSVDEALGALQSGLVGETEPLRKFGVNINDATLRAEALRQGLITSVKQGLDPQQKALAAQALVFKQTQTAQGDFARTSDGLANQQRIAGAQFDDLKTKLGQGLLPVTLKVVEAFNGSVKAVGSVRRELAPFSGILTPIAAGLGAAGVALGAYVAGAKIAAVSQLALNVAVSANPFVLAGVALAGLTAGIVVAYKRSATFRSVVSGAFTAVRIVVADSVKLITAQLDFFLGGLSSVITAASHIPIVGSKFRDAAQGIDEAREKLRGVDDAIRGVRRSAGKPITFHVNVDDPFSTGTLGQLPGAKRKPRRKKGFSAGGLVPGFGNTDSFSANLMPGEFVVRKSAVKKIGAGALASLNGGSKGFNLTSGPTIGSALTAPLNARQEATFQRPADVFVDQSRLRTALTAADASARSLSPRRAIVDAGVAGGRQVEIHNHNTFHVVSPNPDLSATKTKREIERISVEALDRALSLEL